MGNYSFEVGYNFFYKDSESVKLKHKWKDNIYGILHINQATGADFFAAANVGATDGVTSNISNDTSTAVGLVTIPNDVRTQAGVEAQSAAISSFAAGNTPAQVGTDAGNAAGNYIFAQTSNGAAALAGAEAAQAAALAVATKANAINAGDIFEHSPQAVNPAPVDADNPGGAEYYVNNESSANAKGLDLDAAASPSQTTHKIYGGAGYIFDDWEYPVMVGIGGGYEFANSDALENWQLWAKFGVQF